MKTVPSRHTTYAGGNNYLLVKHNNIINQEKVIPELLSGVVEISLANRPELEK